MRIITDGEQAESYRGWFSGNVELEMLRTASRGDDRPDAARVTFHAGAVTNWHSHPGGQLLLLLAGTGRIGNQAEQVAEVAAGTFVDTPPHERHWHGAAPESDCTWLTITWGTTDWEHANPDVR